MTLLLEKVKPQYLYFNDGYGDHLDHDDYEDPIFIDELDKDRDCEVTFLLAIDHRFDQRLVFGMNDKIYE